MDLMTVVFLLRYERRPAHFFGGIGIATLMVGVSFGLYLTVLKLLGHDIGRRPLLILAVLLIVVGVQILATGLIAELLVHMNRNDMPFLVRRTLDNQNAPAALPPARESGLGALEPRNPIGARRLD
jgi:hypothetical protein